MVKSLTGFDIMEDENTFKDVYDILVGIGKEWNNLTDVERASLGEALAGKRNSNALFAVLQNVDLLESVYETAENSAGSAAREQENYAKTIQYSINVFKASAQELATQILDSSVVKSVVDSGTNLINALMNLGAILSPIVSLLGEALSIILKIASVVSSNPIGAMFEIGAIAKYIIYLRNVSSAKNADTVATIAEKSAVDSETVSEGSNAAAKNANVASSNALSLAMIREAFQANGLTGVINTLTAAYTGLSTASKIALGIAAGFAIFEIGKKVVDAFTTSTAELKQKAEESAQEVSELESKLSSIETRINALNDKKSLSFVEQDELDKLNETKASLEAQLKLKQLIAAEDAKKVEESAVDDYNKKNKVKSKYKSFEANYYGTRFTVQDEVGLDEELQLAMNAYDDAKQKYLEEIAKGDSADSKLLKSYQKSMDEAESRATEIAKEVSANTENITGVTEEGKAILANAASISANYELFMAKINNTAIDSLSETAKRLYLVNKASESNVGSDIISYLSKNISAEEIDKLLHLDGFTFDKVKTLDDLKNLLHDVKDEVYKNTPLNVTTMLTESDKKDGNQVSLKDLKEEASVLKTLEDELKEKTRFSVDTMKEIASYYPEAESSLRDYMLGLIDETTLFEKLKEVYQEDAEKYNDVLRTELLSTRQFTEKVLNNNVDLYNAIKDVYGEDYVNFKSLAEMKYDVDHNLIKTLLSEWAGYADVMSNMTDGLSYEQYEAQLDAEVAAGKISEEMMAEYLQAWSTASNWDKVSKSPEVEKYLNLKDKINSALNSLSASDYDLPDVSWETIGVLKGGDSDSGSGSQPKIFDWYERFINNIARAYSRLKTVVSDATTLWINRNNALEESMGVLSKEISAQQKAYEFYISMFEQSSISAEYKELIKNGALRSDSISDSDLADEIQNAIDWYDKAQDALDQVQSLGIELKELSKTRFDNVKSEYEEFINQIEHSTSMLQNQQDLLEAQGYLASTALYSNLITTEQKNLETLRAEYHALVNAMNQFTGEKYSETWYDMQSDINSVAEAIQEAQKQLVEYNNEMRQVKWDSFDRVRDTVQDIIDESEFMYGLLEKNKLLDEKGYFNANGVAAQALLAEKYNVYMNQADAYAKEILEIDKQLATDPYNTKLLDRRKELLDAQREAINGANSEKDALKDLIEEAYNAQLDSLQKIIDKYKEMMQTAKDAYDYEKNVGDQVQTIASLEKQLNAYTLDNSEEGMLRRQQLTAELEEAKEQLQETEYERLISDTETLLDQVTTEFEDWMNARLDNVDLLLQEVINASNMNATSINDTLQTTANDVGYTITNALSNIWNGSSGMREIMILYQNDFNNQATAINSSINSIGQSIINILNKANETSEKIINDVKNGTNTVNIPSPSSVVTNNVQPSNNNSSERTRVSEDIFWHKRDGFPKSMLNINTSIVDRLKYNDFDSSFNARAHYWESLFGGAYTGSYSQNVQMLDWLKQNGYAKGIRRLHSSMNGYAWTNEDGEELIRTSDGAILTPVGNGGTVFNNKMTDTLWDFAKNPADYIKDYDTTTVLREGTSQTIDVGGFNIQVVANNPEEFARGLKNVMAKDSKAQKMIQEIVLGQTIGNNSLTRNKYL